jgi:hypothetical protein
MNKVLIGLILIAVIGGGWWFMKKPMVPTNNTISQESAIVKTSPLRIENGVVWLSMGVRPLSMVDLSISSLDGDAGTFTVNKEVFNSELLNQVEENGVLHLVLGIMKSTSELPKGDIMIGTLTGSTGQINITGKITLPGEEGGAPMEEVVEYGGGLTQ